MSGWASMHEDRAEDEQEIRRQVSDAIRDGVYAYGNFDEYGPCLEFGDAIDAIMRIITDLNR